MLWGCKGVEALQIQAAVGPHLERGGVNSQSHIPLLKVVEAAQGTPIKLAVAVSGWTFAAWLRGS